MICCISSEIANEEHPGRQVTGSGGFYRRETLAEVKQDQFWKILTYNNMIST